jgi:hypothetical protein
MSLIGGEIEAELTSVKLSGSVMPTIKPRRILVAYSMASTYVPTTLEYLLALKNFTNYEVDYVHVTQGAWLNFDINEYDVVFHNYCARLCFDGYVSQHYEKALMNFRGLKILAVQDDTIARQRCTGPFVD